MSSVADSIAAYAGTSEDRNLHGGFTKLAKAIAKAERFRFDLDATLAADGVARSKPSSILSAIEKARPPFPRTWIEYPFRELVRAKGMEVAPETGERPSPRHVGFLLEERGPDVVMITTAWSYDRRPPNISPFAMLTASEPDALAPEGVMMQAFRSTGLFRELHRHGWDRQQTQPMTFADVKGALAAGQFRWGCLPDDEVRALVELQRHHEVGLCPYLAPFVLAVVERLSAAGPRGEAELSRLRQQWAEDWEGEGSLAQAMLLLINAKNGTAIEPAPDLSRLNRARAKRRQPPLFEHKLVKLRLNGERHAARSGDGSGRGPLRAHLCRGHFKLRKSGLFWWSAHVRGSATKGVIQHSYEVNE